MKLPPDRDAWFQARLQIDRDHPAAAGHFPGNPIVPGALLLAYVLTVVPEAPSRQVKVAKFLRPIRPGDPLVTRWHMLPNGDTEFECGPADSAAPAMTGIIRASSK